MIDLERERCLFEGLPQIKEILRSGDIYFSILSNNYTTKKQSLTHCVYFINGSWHGWIQSAQRKGYKLVPVVANKKMLKAGYDAHNDFFFDGQVQDVYKAMIGASE